MSITLQEAERNAEAGRLVSCRRCDVPYRPALTTWECPVCATPAPGPSMRVRRWLLDPDHRFMAWVLGATITNLAVVASLAFAMATIT